MGTNPKKIVNFKLYSKYSKEVKTIFFEKAGKHFFMNNEMHTIKHLNH